MQKKRYPPSHVVIPAKAGIQCFYSAFPLVYAKKFAREFGFALQKGIRLLARTVSNVYSVVVNVNGVGTRRSEIA